MVNNDKCELVQLIPAQLTFDHIGTSTPALRFFSVRAPCILGAAALLLFAVSVPVLAGGSYCGQHIPLSAHSVYGKFPAWH